MCEANGKSDTGNALVRARTGTGTGRGTGTGKALAGLGTGGIDAVGYDGVPQTGSGKKNIGEKKKKSRR